MKYEVYSTQNSEMENAPWSKVEEKFLKNNDIVNKIYEANMVDLDQDGAYITSVGACKGDSGGPMFTKSKKNNIQFCVLPLYISPRPPASRQTRPAGPDQRRPEPRGRVRRSEQPHRVCQAQDPGALDQEIRGQQRPLYEHKIK